MNDKALINNSTLSNIADEIRNKTGKTDNIAGGEFSTEIRSIDRLRKMNVSDGFENGYFGNLIAQLAADWHLQRVVGTDTFTYQNTNIFTKKVTDGDSPGGSQSGSNWNEDENNSGTEDSDSNEDDVRIAYIVRSSDGKSRIDCSAFISLLLRGIQWSNSPYSKHTESLSTWDPSTELQGYYGTNGYEFPMIDRQPGGEFTDLGFENLSSLRTAADFAEFFYKIGYVVFDGKTDGEPYSDLYKLLKPGDLLFWSKSGANETQKRRFRGISHVAIVSERVDRFFEVTTGNKVVLYSKFQSKYEQIVLIVRPNYKHSSNIDLVPVGVNLIHYPWNYGAIYDSEESGIHYYAAEKNSNGDCGIRLQGTSTGAYTRTLKGSSLGTGYIHLVPGDYKLSGMTGTGIQSTACALQVRDENDVDFETPIRAYDGTDATFTIENERDVMIKLYIGSGRTLDCTIYPRLELV